MKKILALTSALFLAGATAAPVVAQQYDPGYGYEQSRYDDGDDRYDNQRDDDRDGYRDSDRYADQGGDRYYDDRQGNRYDDRRDGYRSDRDGYRNGDSRSERRHDRRRYAQQRYRAASRYAYPRGYRAGNWHVGSRLPYGYFPRSNYVDYRSYRLSTPPRGYQWVRIDHDVYLVSPGSGLIRDVLYGLFY